MGGEHDGGGAPADATQEESRAAVVAVVGLLDAAVDRRRHAERRHEPGLPGQVRAAHHLEPQPLPLRRPHHGLQPVPRVAEVRLDGAVHDGPLLAVAGAGAVVERQRAHEGEVVDGRLHRRVHRVHQQRDAVLRAPRAHCQQTLVRQLRVECFRLTSMLWYLIAL